MRFAAPALALALLAGCAELPSQPESPSFIINGQPTGSAYGAVGAVLYDFGGDGIDGNDQLCTGSLIAPTVFLTAGHCVTWLPAAAQLYVSFAPDLVAGPLNAIPAASFAAHPGYTHDSSNPRDLAVLLLGAGATTGITPLHLPPAGYLDALAARGGLRGRSFVNVGYGVSMSLVGRPISSWNGQRAWSTSPFQSLRPTFLSLLMATRATEMGGDCYGDSGGPKFLQGDERTIVATVSWGDAPCRATSIDYRLDTPWARAFLGSYVALP